MKILVVGSGGREHAIVWAVSRYGHRVYCAPGNAGIARLAECVDIEPLNIPALVNFARRQKIDLTIVGPEAPLVAGLADELEKQGLKVFGPKSAAAQLEGDKSFAKRLMLRYRIPTAQFEVFDDYERAIRFLTGRRLPVVIKASGLAGGKGVEIARSFEQAQQVLSGYMREDRLGAAGRTVVIEEYLTGEEVSIIGLCDGKRVRFMIPSQDHKRLLDNDEGPNTGGMGAYAPVPVVTEEVFRQIVERVFEPLLKCFAQEGIDYRGAIYAGLMLTDDGPKVLEFNCRLGDPEAQAILPLFEGDFAEVCRQCAEGGLSGQDADIPPADRWALCVVLASKGYPGSYEKGLPISGEVEDGENLLVFHAGTRMENGRLVTSGGRVLAVTGLGRSLPEARQRAYYGVGRIHFPGMQYRHDIGFRGLRHISEG
ncbi:MAG: phosphoribosylamine--glycine ligase [candidate division WOR-3 bacterium]|uniref:Phosphoribosylamine--glycine ligase n=1 Tax=candidate division WOR-3 bacterium TaxID=2052148 RepID=A0A7C3EMJ4_UNCW3|nr:phosphoribosylamine--glycine ligase [candidate division WOR-3 bacterium]